MRKRKVIINIFVIISFLIISVISGLLLLNHHVLVNMSDAQFHLKRISEIIEDINNGHFLPTFSFNQFHGSAVMSVYPYLNLIPIYIMSLIFKSKISLIYVLFMTLTFIGLVISFYSSLRFSKNRSISYVFSIIYMISNVFIGYYLNIMDLGASFAFIFLPLIIFGFLDILKGYKDYYKLSLGMILVIFSHIPDTLIFILFLLLWLLINIKLININKFWIFVKSAILSLLVTSIFWLPLLNLIIHNRNHIHFVNLVNPQGITISEFIRNAVGNVSVTGLGFFATLTIIISIFFYKSFGEYIKQMYWLSILIIIFSSSLFISFLPHTFVSVLSHFQFMYRFLIIPILLLSYIFSYIVSNSQNSKLLIIGSILFAICLQLVGQTFYVDNFASGKIPVQKNGDFYQIRTSNQFDYIINKKTDGANPTGKVTSKSTGFDYYPKRSVSNVNNINNNLGESNLHKHILFHHIGYNNFSFDTNRNLYKLKLPFVKYDNEHLRLYLNHKQIHYHTDKNDTIVVNNIKKGSNVLYIRALNNSWLNLIKWILLIIGACWLVICYLRGKYNLLLRRSY